MGICFSKKNNQKEQLCSTTTPQDPPGKSVPHRPSTGTTATPRPAQAQQAQAALAPAVPGKKQIFVAVPNKDRKALLKGTDKHAPAVAAEKKETTAPEVSANYKNGGFGGPHDEDSVTTSTVRASSCTKEEVESILIQCGRLSRNSSAVEDEYRRSRKRSYDFDCPERSVEEGRELKPQPNRASPQRHRRTPSRERETSDKKRSGSRERSSSAGVNGGRRVSRSPARRSDIGSAASQGPSSAVEVNNRQAPGRMVSIPAREKPSEAGATGTAGRSKRGGEVIRSASPRSRSPANPSRPGNENIRSASPRSRSPANPSRPGNENCSHSLSRSSSRKADNSPYRRNPMSEVDGNAVLRAEQQVIDEKRKKAEEGAKKPGPFDQSQKSGENTGCSVRRNAVVEVTNMVSSSVGRRGAKEELAERARMVFRSGEVIVALAGTGQELQPSTRLVLTRNRSSRSRRSSRDLDVNQDGVPTQTNSYAALLLDDIHNYHQQTAAADAPAFSLPACVSKACSILEAVADLNERSRVEDDYPLGHHRRRRRSVKTVPAHEELVESKEAARDDEDLMKPSLHKYGIELDEPQESAGSNSFAGQTPCDPAQSVDSADQSWMAPWPSHGPNLKPSGRRGRNGDTHQSPNGSAASSSSWQQQPRVERGDNVKGASVSVS